MNPAAYALKGIREQDCLAMPLCTLLWKGKVSEPLFQGVKKYRIFQTIICTPPNLGGKWGCVL